MRQPLFFLHFTCRFLPLTAFPDTRQEAFVIWFCFMMYYRREAKQMNEKIQALKR